MTLLAVILIVVGFGAGIGLTVFAVCHRGGRDFERYESRRAALFARAREEIDQLAGYVPEHWERRR